MAFANADVDNQPLSLNGQTVGREPCEDNHKGSYSVTEVAFRVLPAAGEDFPESAPVAAERLFLLLADTFLGTTQR